MALITNVYGHIKIATFAASPDPLEEKQLQKEHRSECPINLALEVFGDRWSLIVIRDILFWNRRHFGTLLSGSEEGIASNILADRLRRLTKSKLIVRSGDPSHKQKAIYSLTEKAIELLPILILLAVWGAKYLRLSKKRAFRATVLERRSPKLLRKFMSELRHSHIAAQGLSPMHNAEGGVANAVFQAALARGRKKLRLATKGKRPINKGACRA